MHLDGRTRLRLGTATNRSSRWLAILFPFSLVGSVLGQGFLAPPAGFQGAPAVPTMGNVNASGGTQGRPANRYNLETMTADDEATGQVGGQPSVQPKSQANPNVEANPQAVGEPTGTAAAAVAAPLTSLMSWGALHLHARASYQFLYATGIHTSPGNSADTFTHTLTPGLTLDLGPHATFSYSPSFRFYSQRDFHNTIDHALNLSGGVRYGDWTFGTTHSFTISDEPLVETSSQTEQKEYSGAVSATYHANEKLSLSTTAGANLDFVGGTNSGTTNGVGGSSSLTDSQEFFGGESVDYRFDERISAGVGVNISYSQQDPGFRSIDEEFDGHALWHPGDKLTAHVSIGIKHLDFLNGNSDSSWNPIYSANVGYQLFEHTAFSIYANRTIESSLFEGQIVESTAVGVGFQQRLLGKLELSLGFGYTKADYKTTATNLSTSRGDEGTSYSAGLSVPFLTHCSFGTFYQYSQNTSSANGFGYSSSQAGMTLTWAY